jgi:hypothetical protein
MGPQKPVKHRRAGKKKATDLQELEMEKLRKREQAILAVLAPMQEVQCRSFIELLAHQERIKTDNRREMRLLTANVMIPMSQLA